MDTATEEICLQKLEELVFDEDKIVTISILCKILDISVGEAKELFEKYVSDQKINPGKISTTYLISGTLKNSENFIEIVNDTCLKERKKKYSSITDKVVYSVQKKNEIDFNLIALSEKSDEGYFRPTALKGSIVSDKCIKRVIKIKELPPVPPPKYFEKQKPSSFFKPVPKNQSNGESAKSTDFTSKDAKPQVNKKAGGLSNFLSQNSTTQKVKKEKSDEDERDAKKVKIESNNYEETVEKSVENKKVDKRSDEVKAETVKSTEVKNKKASKRKKTPKKDQDGKKRKRIIVDSESDDDLFENAKEEKMVVEESDEEPPPVNIKPKVPSTPVPKNKRRKAVEKTYEDEDGYVVTKTEYVLVSASEDEEENIKPEKEEKPKIVPKTEPKEGKKVSPVKGGPKKKGKAVAANQPTLMNFFKKK